jgi:3-hydroxy-9,10-secoandrosta-1,3,5(10)-triene-9,17-dione monooxygenase
MSDDNRRWPLQAELPYASLSSSPDGLVQAALNLAPNLRKRAPDAARAGRLSQQTIEEMRENGALNLMKPLEYGGLDLSVATVFDITSALAIGDMSAAWVSTLYTANNFALGMQFKREIADLVLGDPKALCASVVAATKFKSRWIEDGLYIEDGMWVFNSGVYHAKWDNLTIPSIADPHTGEIGPRAFLIPTAELEILDDWNVSGLSATGSTSVRLRETLIPYDRISLPPSRRLAEAPFGPRWIYRLPPAPFGWGLIAACILGAAESAIQIVLDLPKKNAGAVTHYQIGDASAKIAAGRALLRCDAEAFEAAAKAGRPIPFEEHLRGHRNLAYAARLGREAVDILVDGAGGSFLRNDHPLNIVWRNVRGAAQHKGVFLNDALEAYGRSLCGLDSQSVLLQVN